MSKWIIVVLCLILVGCTTTRKSTFGRDFDSSKITSVKKGLSTRNNVLRIYGEPSDKQLDENSNEKWIYLYSVKINNISLWDYSSRGDSRTKKLEIIFNPNGIVQNYVFSDSVSPISYGK